MLSKLDGNNEHLTIKIRVICLWESLNSKQDEQCPSTDHMILSDENIIY